MKVNEFQSVEVNCAIGVITLEVEDTYEAEGASISLEPAQARILAADLLAAAREAEAES